MNFENALRLLKAGHTVRLKSWGKNQYLALKGKHICRFDSGKEITSYWSDFSSEILSHQWEVIEPLTFYDQGHAEGYSEGYDKAVDDYFQLRWKGGMKSQEELDKNVLLLKEGNKREKK